MSNDDKRGSKDNADRQHKPKSAQNYEHAPRGHLGTNNLLGPGIGGSTSPRINTSKTEHTEQEPQKHVDPTKDDRVVFFETDDPEVNAQWQKTHRMIPKDGEGRGVTKEGPSISQSDFAKAFRQAHGQTQAMRQSKSIDPE